jgi:hypothetical protein
VGSSSGGRVQGSQNFSSQGCPRAAHVQSPPSPRPTPEHDGWQNVPGTWPYQTNPTILIPSFHVSKVGGAGQKQFLIETFVCTKEGGESFPQILVDTGAQPNLVRKGLFPRHLFRRSSNPLNLMAANQKRIDGGTHTTLLTLMFRHPQTRKLLKFRGSFYEAEISVDIVLSNSWMAENKIVPLPEFNQLGFRDGSEIICLSPWSLEENFEDQEIDTTPFRLIRDDNVHVHFVNDENSPFDFWCPESVGESDSKLNEEECSYIHQILSQPDVTKPRHPNSRDANVSGMVQTEVPSEHPLAKTLRDKLYEDYKDTVFRKEIYPNPQPRGPSGMATATLKPGAVPKYCRAIPCHGEKLEALKKILEKWKSQKKT